MLWIGNGAVAVQLRCGSGAVKSVAAAAGVGMRDASPDVRSSNLLFQKHNHSNCGLFAFGIWRAIAIASPSHRRRIAAVRCAAALSPPSCSSKVNDPLTTESIAFTENFPKVGSVIPIFDNVSAKKDFPRNSSRELEEGKELVGSAAIRAQLQRRGSGDIVSTRLFSDKDNHGGGGWLGMT